MNKRSNKQWSLTRNLHIVWLAQLSRLASDASLTIHGLWAGPVECLWEWAMLWAHREEGRHGTNALCRDNVALPRVMVAVRSVVR